MSCPAIAWADVPSPGSSRRRDVERVRLVVGGRGFNGGRGRRPGLGGDGGDAGGSGTSSLGMTAGFILASEILSEVPPGRAILNEFWPLSRTRKGPT